MLGSRIAFRNLLAPFVLAALTVSLFLHAVGNSDIFWMIKSGEWTARLGIPLSIDIFSYTKAGTAWVDSEWLSGLVYFAVDALAGFKGLSLLSLFLGLALAAVLFKSMKKDCGEGLALLLTALVLIGSASRISELRPELFGFLFFTLFLAVLSRGGVAFHTILYLLPVQLLWNGMHGSFVMGPLLAIAFVRRFEKGWTLPTALFLGMMLNPYGVRVLTFPFTQAFQGFVLSNSSDWAGPFYRGELCAGIVVVAILAMLGIWIAVARRFSCDVVLFVISMVFTAAAFHVARFIPLALIASSFFIARMAPSFGLFIGRTAGLAVVVASLVLTLVLGGPLCGVRLNDGKLLLVTTRPVGVGADVDSFPGEAVSFISKELPVKKVFNDMAFGGYIMYKAWPQVPVFTDTRTVLYGDEFYREYSDALFNEEKFEALRKKWNFELVIYDTKQIAAPGGPLKFLIGDPRWRIVFKSPNSVVFVYAG